MGSRDVRKADCPGVAQSRKRIGPVISSVHLRLRFTLSDTPSRGKTTSRLGVTYRGGVGRDRTLTYRCVWIAGSKSNERDGFYTLRLLGLTCTASRRQLIWLITSGGKPPTRSVRLPFLTRTSGLERYILDVVPRSGPSVSSLWPGE